MTKKQLEDRPNTFGSKREPLEHHKRVHIDPAESLWAPGEGPQIRSGRLEASRDAPRGTPGTGPAIVCYKNQRFFNDLQIAP